MEPIGKATYRLPPNEFSVKHPNIKKYNESHAVEIFAKKFWNTVSGNRWGSDVTTLKFIKSDKLNEIFSLLQSDCIKRNKSSKASIKQNQNSNPKNEYARLTQESLEFVLSKIDHFDEENWGGGQDGGGVVNILARVYGEDGRRPFIEWSRGDYSGRIYERFEEGVCNNRFNRAIKELSTRPSGFGVPQLCRLAEVSIASVNFVIENNTVQQKNQPPTPSIPELVFRYTNEDDYPLQVSENLKTLMDYRGIIVRYNQITKNSEILLPNMQCVLDEVDNTAITFLTDAAIKSGLSSARIMEMSTALASQNLRILLPPDYDRDLSHSWPLMVLTGQSDLVWDQVPTAAIANGTVIPLVIVALVPDSSHPLTAQSLPIHWNRDVLPWLSSHYRVVTSAGSVFWLAWGDTGPAVSEAAAAHPDLFGNVWTPPAGMKTEDPAVWNQSMAQVLRTSFPKVAP
jgi:hypothetical protein